jgi:hypothetical protein
MSSTAVALRPTRPEDLAAVIGEPLPFRIKAITVLDGDKVRREWVRLEAEFRLYKLPPRERGEALVNPSDGPQRFLTPKRRLRMLREIDDELRWGKRSGANERTP